MREYAAIEDVGNVIRDIGQRVETSGHLASFLYGPDEPVSRLIKDISGQR